jgi:transcriptional regulator with XRE-family HTH domain
MTLPQDELWSQRIRTARNNTKGKDGNPLSKRAFADFLGVARGAVQFWEKGLRRLDQKSLRLVAGKCDLTPEWLAGDPAAHEHPDQLLTGAELEDNLAAHIRREVAHRASAGGRHLPGSKSLFSGKVLLAFLEKIAIGAAEENAARVRSEGRLLNAAITVGLLDEDMMRFTRRVIEEQRMNAPLPTNPLLAEHWPVLAGNRARIWAETMELAVSEAAPKISRERNASGAKPARRKARAGKSRAAKRGPGAKR